MTLSRSLSSAVRSAAEFFAAEKAAVSLVSEVEGGRFAAIARSVTGAVSLGVFLTEEAALARLAEFGTGAPETDPDPFAGSRDSTGQPRGFLEDDPMAVEW